MRGITWRKGGSDAGCFYDGVTPWVHGGRTNISESGAYEWNGCVLPT